MRALGCEKIERTHDGDEESVKRNTGTKLQKWDEYQRDGNTEAQKT